MSAGRAVALVLAFAAAAAGPAAARPHDEPRFGSPGWVAPEPVPDSASALPGPRVEPPDHPRGWETALRAPFRVAFSPLRLVAAGVGKAADLAMPKDGEPSHIHVPRPGPVLAPAFRAGALKDVGAGPGLTWAGFPAPGADLRAAATWSTIDRRTASLEETIGAHRATRFDLRAAYDRQPNRRFYGLGNDAPRADSSIYRLESATVRGALLVGQAPRRQLRAFAGWSTLSPARGSVDGPPLESKFTPATAPFEHRATQELFVGLGGDWARLDDPRDPSRGVHGRAEVERDIGVRARDPDFDRFRLEARAYVPVFAPRRVLAFRAVEEGVDPRGSTAALPYYRLPTNGDGEPFAGYPSQRFADRRLVLARAEYRWLVIYRVSALLFDERVEVAPSTAALTARAAHPTWGGGLRFALTEHTVARAELGKSHDGVHASLRLGDDW